MGALRKALLMLVLLIEIAIMLSLFTSGGLPDWLMVQPIIAIWVFANILMFFFIL